MGWKEAQRRYRKREALADQSVEDRVARRVLRGLGLVQRQLPDMENRLFGKADFDEALWPRTLAIWKRLAPVYHRVRTVEVLKLDQRRGHAEILERLEEVDKDDPVKPVFFTILDTIKDGWAYIPVNEDSRIGDFKPPFKIVDQLNQMYIVLQPIDTYVANKGPYELGIDDE